jgi:hypothetical protein
VKPFTNVSVVVLAFIAMMQLLRFVMGWEVSVNGVHVPVWVSGVAFLIAGGLAVMVWREARR